MLAGMGRVHGFMFMHMGSVGSGLRLVMLKLAGRHLCGHRIAHPAAQGQQGNQQGEEQMAHGVMIGDVIGKFRSGLCGCPYPSCTL